jgi:hypothetical protein
LREDYQYRESGHTVTKGESNMGIPIYYTVVKQFYNPQMLSVWEIIKVIECDLSDVHDMYYKEIAPLLGDGSSYQQFMFYREPENPFRDFSKE